MSLTVFKILYYCLREASLLIIGTTPILMLTNTNNRLQRVRVRLYYRPKAYNQD